MIKNLYSNSSHIKLSHHGGVTINQYPSQPSTGGVGMVRYNPSSSTLEVYDGMAWQNINSSAEITLSQETEALLAWAMAQKLRHENLERLAKDNVTIRDALNNLYKAEEALQIIAALCETGSGDARDPA